MHISDEAVEAAAKAVYGGDHLDGSPQRDAWLVDFRKALEAAAPHMFAPVMEFLDKLEAADTSVRTYVTAYRVREVLGLKPGNRAVLDEPMTGAQAAAVSVAKQEVRQKWGDLARTLKLTQKTNEKKPMIITGVPESISRDAYKALFNSLGIDPAVTKEVSFGADGIHATVFALDAKGERVMDPNVGSVKHVIHIPVKDERG